MSDRSSKRSNAWSGPGARGELRARQRPITKSSATVAARATVSIAGSATTAPTPAISKVQTAAHWTAKSARYDRSPT